MTPFDIAVGLGSFALAGIGIVFVLYVVRTSGRDRPHDPEAVDRFIAEERAKRRMEDPEPEHGSEEWTDWFVRRAAEPGPDEEAFWAKRRQRCKKDFTD